MKIKTLLFIFLALGLNGALLSQEPATEAGDDFDLYGAIGLFEDAEDIEDHEKKLNSEANDVNNLDLNADNEVDMVQLVEVSEGSTKVFVIRAVLGENDFQDIARIEMEKFDETEISCQAIGGYPSSLVLFYGSPGCGLRLARKTGGQV